MYAEVAKGLVPEFRLMPGKEVVKEWEFLFINYGQARGNGIEEAVVIIIDPDAERFAVKKKGPPTPSEKDTVLVRTEAVSKYFGRFEGGLRARILKEEEETIEARLIKVGEVTRRKRYIYITNTRTGRNYKVGVDVCRSDDHQMSQLEIEYMGRTGILPITDHAVNEIRREIDTFTSTIQAKFNDCLFSTSLTKFQWLTSLGK